MLNNAFSTDWYARQHLVPQPILASKNRRPDYVVDVLADYLRFSVEHSGQETEGRTYQFGMPYQIILRDPSEDRDPLFERSVEGLPTRNAPTLARNLPSQDRPLPQGLIYVADPDSSETMIFLAKRQAFDEPSDRIATNLLMDYMGAYQGSEMFRVIRQELLAAYDPRTEFRHIDKTSAILSLSATVEAQE